MLKYKDYEHLKDSYEPKRNPYFPKILPRIKVRLTDDLFHFWKLTFRIPKVELWFGVPLDDGYVDRYVLEYLSTFRGRAKRRLLVCWDYKPAYGARLQWQEKFKPLEGTWYDDYPTAIMEKRNV